MKKIIVFAVCLVLLSMLTLPCFAATDTLTMTNATAQPGDTVYLTVTLTESIVGNTIGLSYTYDDQVLTPVPDSCSWAQKGSLQNFSNDNSAVWAVSNPIDLKGTICVLAFKVKDKASFEKTQVTCSVILRANSTDLGIFTAKAEVLNQCEHSYSAWKNIGEVGHSRTCSKCNITYTQSHQWDEGEIKEKPGDVLHNLKIFTCAVCSGTKEQEIPAGNVPTTATKPTEKPEKETTVPTLPTKPTTPANNTKPTETRPTHQPHTAPTTAPTVPHKEGNQQDHTKPTFQDYNKGPEPSDPSVEPGHEGHNHSADDFLMEGENGRVEHRPEAIPIDTNSSNQTINQDAHNHDHEEEITDVSQSISYEVVIAVVAVIVIMVVGALMYVKKKR